MSNLKKRVLVLMAVFILVLANGFSALAFTSSDVARAYESLTSEDKAKVIVAPDKTSVTIDGTRVQTSPTSQSNATAVSIGGVTVYVTQGNIDPMYNALTNLSATTTKTQNDKGAEGANAKIDSMVQMFDVSADIQGASLAFSGFKQPLALTIGVVTYFVLIFFGFVTSLDIAFITIPIFRGFCNEKGEFGGLSGTTSDGTMKMRFISDEAVYAVRNAEVGSGKNALVAYTQKRAYGVIMLGIVITLLLTGNLGIIMKIGVKLASGIISGIQIFVK